jgi:hypothetical protein
MSSITRDLSGVTTMKLLMQSDCKLDMLSNSGEQTILVYKLDKQQSNEQDGCHNHQQIRFTPGR